jgi:hypothetical protein
VDIDLPVPPPPAPAAPDDRLLADRPVRRDRTRADLRVHRQVLLHGVGQVLHRGLVAVEGEAVEDGEVALLVVLDHLLVVELRLEPLEELGVLPLRGRLHRGLDHAVVLDRGRARDVRELLRDPDVRLRLELRDLGDDLVRVAVLDDRLQRRHRVVDVVGSEFGRGADHHRRHARAGEGGGGERGEEEGTAGADVHRVSSMARQEPQGSYQGRGGAAERWIVGARAAPPGDGRA